MNLALDAEKKAQHLAPVRLWLAAEAAKAKMVWTKAKVEETWRSEEFRKKVMSMQGVTGRDHVIAAIMLLVCDIFGWDYEDQLKEILADRKTLDEYSEEAEVAEAILARAGSETPTDLEIPTEELLIAINEARGRARLKSMTPHKLGGILKELGFRKGNDWERVKDGPNRDRAVIRPHGHLKELAERAELPETPEGNDRAPPARELAYEEGIPTSHPGAEKAIKEVISSMGDEKESLRGWSAPFVQALRRATEGKTDPDGWFQPSIVLPAKLCADFLIHQGELLRAGLIEQRKDREGREENVFRLKNMEPEVV